MKKTDLVETTAEHTETATETVVDDLDEPDPLVVNTETKTDLVETTAEHTETAIPTVIVDVLDEPDPLVVNTETKTDTVETTAEHTETATETVVDDLDEPDPLVVNTETKTDLVETTAEHTETAIPTVIVDVLDEPDPLVVNTETKKIVLVETTAEHTETAIPSVFDVLDETDPLGVNIETKTDTVETTAEHTETATETVVDVLDESDPLGVNTETKGTDLVETTAEHTKTAIPSVFDVLDESNPLGVNTPEMKKTDLVETTAEHTETATETVVDVLDEPDPLVVNTETKKIVLVETTDEHTETAIQTVVDVLDEPDQLGVNTETKETDLVETTAEHTETAIQTIVDVLDEPDPLVVNTPKMKKTDLVETTAEHTETATETVVDVLDDPDPLVVNTETKKIVLVETTAEHTETAIPSVFDVLDETDPLGVNTPETKKTDLVETTAEHTETASPTVIVNVLDEPDPLVVNTETKTDTVETTAEHTETATETVVDVLDESDPLGVNTPETKKTDLVETTAEHTETATETIVDVLDEPDSLVVNTPETKKTNLVETTAEHTETSILTVVDGLDEFLIDFQQQEMFVHFELEQQCFFNQELDSAISLEEQDPLVVASQEEETVDASVHSGSTSQGDLTDNDTTLWYYSPCGRKRVSNPQLWLRNKKAKLCQSGKEYVSSSGKIVSARVPKHTVCRHGKRFKDSFHCQTFVTKQEEINRSYWNLTAADKSHFLGRTTARVCKANHTKTTNSRRRYTFNYFFFDNGKKLPVCLKFFVNTLNISVKRVEWYHKMLVDSSTGAPRPGRRGKHCKSKVSDESIKTVIEHINSFPRVESHYCRSTTTRQYLDSTLCLPSMYEMYCAKYETPPVKLHKYREIFMTKFNLGFHIPRKDKCDKCEEKRFHVNPTNDDLLRYEKHEKSKIITKCQRDIDRAVHSRTHAVICFDLQNVLCLPHANVKSMFYLRKLAVYNLTAHCSIDREGYCAIWAENVAGRSGNDLASALIGILDKVIERHPDLTEITLWSDACVAQNKNCVMTLALMKFIARHEGLKKVTQKFGTPGHSSVQEVDNIHSQIEKRMKNAEVFSPVGLIRLLLRVNMKHPLIIIQLSNFTDYHAAARHLKMKVPFSKIQELTYSRDYPLSVFYRTSFDNQEATTHVAVAEKVLPSCRKIGCLPMLSKEKLTDIEKILKFMPEVDKEYYEAVIRRHTDSNHIKNSLSCGINRASNDNRVTRNSPSDSRIVWRRCTKKGKNAVSPGSVYEDTPEAVIRSGAKVHRTPETSSLKRRRNTEKTDTPEAVIRSGAKVHRTPETSSVKRRRHK